MMESDQSRRCNLRVALDGAEELRGGRGGVAQSLGLGDGLCSVFQLDRVQRVSTVFLSLAGSGSLRRAFSFHAIFPSRAASRVSW